MNKKQFITFIFILATIPQFLHADTSNPTVTADLKDVSGATIGKVVIKFQKDGTAQLIVATEKLSPGEHAFHIHDIGKCDAPDFSSAGPHFNPSQKQHGLHNSMGHHAGDLPNILVGKDGTAKIETILKDEFLNEAALLDGDGTAFIVHENPDDYATDPAGNAGARIACGVSHLLE